MQGCEPDATTLDNGEIAYSPNDYIVTSSLKHLTMRSRACRTRHYSDTALVA
jgi:hypothetical protein